MRNLPGIIASSPMGTGEDICSNVTRALSGAAMEFGTRTGPVRGCACILPGNARDNEKFNRAKI